MATGWDAGVALLVVGYGVSLRRGARRGMVVTRPWLVAGFVAATVILLASVSTTLDVYAHRRAWAHMVQHLVLVMVVPGLLVVGRPSAVLRPGGRPPEVPRTRWGVGSALGAVTHPFVGWCAYAATIVGTHLTSFRTVAMTSPALSDVEQVLYVVVGYVFLLPLVGSGSTRWPLPYLGRLGLLLLGMVPDTIVGIVMLQSDDAGPRHHPAMPAGALSPLEDLHVAGALMWAGGDGLMMLAGVAIALAMVLDRRPQAVVGRRLERVRRDYLLGQLSQGDGHPGIEGHEVDDDDAFLDAYNRMLARLADRSTGPH